MTEIVAFPDAEAVAIGYLKQYLNVSVSTAIPDPRPESFITVIRTGGNRIRLNADSAMLIFECWAAESVAAADLCRTARAYVDAMAGSFVNGQWVYKVTEVGGPAYYPDARTGLARYQFTVMVDLKGGAL